MVAAPGALHGAGAVPRRRSAVSTADGPAGLTSRASWTATRSMSRSAIRSRKFGTSGSTHPRSTTPRRAESHMAKSPEKLTSASWTGAGSISCSTCRRGTASAGSSHTSMSAGGSSTPTWCGKATRKRRRTHRTSGTPTTSSASSAMREKRGTACGPIRTQSHTIVRVHRTMPPCSRSSRRHTPR